MPSIYPGYNLAKWLTKGERYMIQSQTSPNRILQWKAIFWSKPNSTQYTDDVSGSHQCFKTLSRGVVCYTPIANRFIRQNTPASLLSHSTCITSCVYLLSKASDTDRNPSHQRLFLPTPEGEVPLLIATSFCLILCSQSLLWRCPQWPEKEVFSFLILCAWCQLNQIYGIYSGW